MPRPNTAAHNLREPARSKCMSIFQKSNVSIRKFTKYAGPRNLRGRLRASLRNCNACQYISQEPLHTEIERKNAAAKSEHPDQAPVFTPAVTTPACVYLKIHKNIYIYLFKYNEVGWQLPLKLSLKLLANPQPAIKLQDK